MVLATLISELILPSKCYIPREYSHKVFLKLLKIANFMNFLSEKRRFSRFFSVLNLKKWM